MATNARSWRMGDRCPNSQGNYAKELIRIILLCQNPEVWPSFIQAVTDDYASDIQEKLYAFVKSMICSWAGQDDLSQSDAHVIEDCRKLCDLMGWPTEKNKITNGR